MEIKIYEEVKVTLIPIETVENEFSLPFTHNPSLINILELMSVFPLKDQIYIMVNLLTISGYTEREIAEAVGIPYQKYRTKLMQIRKNFAKDGITEL